MTTTVTDDEAAESEPQPGAPNQDTHPPTDAGALPAPPTGSPRAARRLPRHAWLLVAGSGMATVLTRAPRLTFPGIFVFDEVYYAEQGLEIADGGVEVGHTVHPPLAKWLIAAGIRVFGFEPLGWRVMPLLAGAVVVMATVYAAYRLLLSSWWAAFAGLIVLTDGVAFTTGRLALLDGILAAFTTVALAAVAAAVSRPLDVRLRRGATIVTALALGGAVACKWSAIPLVAVAAAALGLLTWRATPRGADRRRALAWTLALLLAVPPAIYVATYVPTLVNFDDSAIGRRLCDQEGDCDPSLVAKVRAIVDDHRSVYRFHRNLDPTNRYAQSAASWVFQTEPVGLVKSSCPSFDPVCSDSDPPGSVRRFITIGNPLIWAAGTLALLWILVVALWRGHLGMGLVVAWAGALWLPWIVSPRLALVPFEAARPGYLFYAAPLVPCVALALAYALREIRGRWRPAVTAAIVVAALFGATLLYPVWTGMPTSRAYLEGLVDP